MSQEAVIAFCTGARAADEARNAATVHPAGICCAADLSYGPHGVWNLLNVYYPETGDGLLPVIVCVHGGGYVYGTKEVYHHYCADLARRGFAVVSFNYRLAPEYHFPAQLDDINAAVAWTIQNSGKFRMDTERLLMVGDSAGAQLASQYAAMLTNPDYAALFDFSMPAAKIWALGLNCGMFDLPAKLASPAFRLGPAYLGSVAPDDSRLRVFEAVTDRYPPAHIVTSCCDFNRGGAEPFARLLRGRGIPVVCQCYGAEDRPDIAHVFHVDIRLPEATVCNDTQCDFLRRQLPA